MAVGTMGEAIAIDKPKGAAGTRPAPVIVIAGPTAAGKSALGLALASETAATIVNADSMQIYRDLPILTAQPDAAAQAAVPHRLYGVLALDDPCSAARWAERAMIEIAAAREAGRLPILIGGTGLYLRALLQGFAPIPPIDPAIRARARAELDASGASGLHRRLAERDPETAARLKPSDSQRLMRAWEVLEATGKPLAWWQAQPSVPPGPVAALRFVVDPPRADLYAACDARFAAMIEAGALQEVASARRTHPGADQAGAGFRALGFRALARHLDGAWSLAEAISAGQQATRNYAKRQRTWFRHQFKDAILLPTIGVDMKFSQSSLAPIRYKIREFLLTGSG